MTADQFYYYMKSIGFATTSNDYYYLDVVKNRMFYRIPTEYALGNITLKIVDIYPYKNPTVDFYYVKFNLYASIYLEKLDFDSLCFELNKFLFLNKRFVNWMKTESRNIKINSILDENKEN